MSIVGPELPGARVLDLFAGSGALGLEAVSRGAASADLVELSPRSLTAIRRNVAALGADDAITVHRGDALRFAEKLEPLAYDVAFADPPYGLGIATRLAERWLDSPFSRVIGIEHRVNEQMPGAGDRRRYGDTVITFYRAAGPVLSLPASPAHPTRDPE